MLSNTAVAVSGCENKNLSIDMGLVLSGILKEITSKPGILAKSNDFRRSRGL
jgi:hypothetical protein